MPVYRDSDVQRDVREMLRGGDQNAINSRGLRNRAVRQVALDIDLRSTKRRTQLSPNLSRQQYNHTAPVDLKGLGIIDIAAQTERGADQKTEFILTTAEEFDRQKTRYKNIVARDDFDFATILRISGMVDDVKQTIHNMDSITANGTWTTDSDNTAANNLTRDTTNFLQGTASLNFDVDTTGTTAILQNSTMTALDLTDFNDDGAIFVWVFIPATTNIQDFILHWGQDSDNHNIRTVTTTNEGLTFFVGWNLLRFDWDDSVTLDGTPTDSDVDYLSLTMTLTAALTTADTAFRYDFIVARRGIVHNLYYYSRYLWQDSDNAYKENSTVDGDFLVVETEEYDMIVEKAVALGGRSIRGKEGAEIRKEALESYKDQKEKYEEGYPSERKILTTTYQEFGALDDTISSASLDT